MEKLRLRQLAADPRLPFGACLCGLGLLAPESALSPAVVWEGRIKAQGLFDPSPRKGQVCSCLRCAARQRCSGGDAPTAQKGTLRRPGHGTSSGGAPAGWERSFLYFTRTLRPWRGAAAPDARDNSNPDGGRFLRSGPSHSPEPSAGQKPGSATRRRHPPHPAEIADPFQSQRLRTPAGLGAQSHPRLQRLAAGVPEPSCLE